MREQEARSHFLIRKCLTDFETRNSKDYTKSLGGYLVDMAQYHLDCAGRGRTAMAAGALTPAVQGLLSTIRDECGHLIDDETNEHHILDALIQHVRSAYNDAYDGIKDEIITLCREAKKYC